MAKRFETTPRGLERTEMPGLLAVRRAPLLRGGRIGKSLFERTEMMECKIKPGHIPSPWEGVAVGATKSLLASTPVIPVNLLRHSRAGGNPEG
jgi:hypothetical protein